MDPIILEDDGIEWSKEEAVQHTAAFRRMMDEAPPILPRQAPPDLLAGIRARLDNFDFSCLSIGRRAAESR